MQEKLNSYKATNLSQGLKVSIYLGTNTSFWERKEMRGNGHQQVLVVWKKLEVTI